MTEDTIGRLTGTTTLVVGASRGLGRGIAEVLAGAGADVVAVARGAEPLSELADAGIAVEVADAREDAVPEALLERHAPRAVVLVAGAAPVVRPLQEHSWETFSVNWETDVRIAFNWLRAILLAPMPSGSRVIVISSGAAVMGSPLSGGYAGAKATQRFITGYAQEEADRADLGISFTAILPKITPLTDLGRPAVQAYAARRGVSDEEYVRQIGEPVTPRGAGAAVLELIEADRSDLAAAYLLTGEGLQPLA